MSPNSKTYLRRAKPLLGTIVDISLHSSSHDSDTLSELMQKCFQRIRDIQTNLSYFDSSSEVFRINRSEPNRAVSIMPETAQLLRLALTLHEESNGSFDVLYRGRKDDPNLRIELHDGDTKVSRSQYAEIDLGGIAKGYAADEAALVASELSDVSGVINAGGDIVFFGNHSFPLSIRSPLHDGRFFDAGYYSNCAVATSVFHENDKSYSISVQSSKCVIADSLTKALWQQNQESRDSLLNKYEAKYMEIDSNLNIDNGSLLN